jgi:hypothetical protein
MKNILLPLHLKCLAYSCGELLVKYLSKVGNSLCLFGYWDVEGLIWTEFDKFMLGLDYILISLS